MIYSVVITENQPANSAEWEALAETCGNLTQSGKFDFINKAIGFRHIYFEVKENNSGQLLAGVKIGSRQVTRFGKFVQMVSCYAQQFGEALCIPDKKQEDVLKYLFGSVSNYLRERRIVSIKVLGFYGNPKLLFSDPHAERISQTDFNTTTIDLSQSEEQLWQNIHPKHRSEVIKGEKRELAFEEKFSREVFDELIRFAYRTTPDKKPESGYFDLLFSQSSPENFRMYSVKENQTALSMAFVFLKGNCAYYAHGGTLTNSSGAGQFLHWNLMKVLKSQGVQFYCLGQVSSISDLGNQKFVEGISKFKRRFGGDEMESASYEIVYRPSLRWIREKLLWVRKKMI